MREWALRHTGPVFKQRRRHAAIYSQGAYSEYPYQENNAGLPSASARENVLGYLEAALDRRFRGIEPSRAGNFKNWCLQAFGPGISERFMFPYNRKLWKFPLEKLTTHWMGRFVPSPKVLGVVEGALRKRSSDAGYNATFLYPDHGGISVLPRGIARGLPDLWHGVGLRSLDLSRHQATLTSGLEVGYKDLVSSLPLPKLVALTHGLPASLRRGAGRLKATSIYNINLGLKGRQPIPYSWVYFPEKEFLFHRAGSASACVPTVAPKGHFSVYVEFSYTGNAPDARALGRHALAKLRELGWIDSPEQVVARVDLDLRNAYVLYDAQRDGIVADLLAFYQKHGVLSVGRYGRWEYGSMESAMEQGIDASRKVLGR
jgi:protoporphyrinogen oxidase